jgi:hypothetical protein
VGRPVKWWAMFDVVPESELDRHRDINSYLEKISIRNMIRFNLGELKVISSGVKPLAVITRGLRKSLYRAGVLKIKPSNRGITRVVVDWDKVREYLGADYLA